MTTSRNDHDQPIQATQNQVTHTGLYPDRPLWPHPLACANGQS